MSDPRAFGFENMDDARIVEALCRARSAVQQWRDGQGTIGPEYRGPLAVPATAALLMMTCARAHELRDMLKIGFSIVGVSEHEAARLVALADDRRFGVALLAAIRGEDLGEALARDAGSSRAESIAGQNGGGR